MELVLKSNRKLFLVTAGITFVVSMALYQLLVILMALWALLMLGGVVPFWSKNKKAVAIQYGCFLGLTLSLAVLIFGPWEFYN